ncbi:hypothetical protein [uncultured Aquimarina sp.]|uniref:hypothetical protein n=1 Tax=uncultured Aquimarina sp. TaxID=575652 RepID=UPI00260FD286|nr:hypothetical protein [uncultured Aquimarina sp.]
MIKLSMSFGYTIIKVAIDTNEVSGSVIGLIGVKTRFRTMMDFINYSKFYE